MPIAKSHAHSLSKHRLDGIAFRITLVHHDRMKTSELVADFVLDTLQKYFERRFRTTCEK